MNFWIGVGSKEHVVIGEDGGFSQVCHDKDKPLRRKMTGLFTIHQN